MMYGREKSDSAIEAKKLANKAGLPAAEQVEPRAGTEILTGDVIDGISVFAIARIVNHQHALVSRCCRRVGH